MSRKYFEAVGRRHCALGFKRWPAHFRSLPDWAREAIVAGYTGQMERPGTRQRAKEPAAESMRRAS